MFETLRCCMTQAFTEKSLDFQQKIIDRSGLGDETYLPDGTARALHASVTISALPQAMVLEVMQKGVAIRI